MAQPLRSALVWAALAVLSAAAWPVRSKRWEQHLAPAAALIAALLLGAVETTVAGVLGVAVVLAVFARWQSGPDRSLMTVVAVAVGVLGVFRLAVTSIPTAWSLADVLGSSLGTAVGGLAGKALWIGATFAGLDLLVLMAIVYAGWLRWTAPLRRQRAICAALAIVAVHLVYLLLLASTTDSLAYLPERPPDPQDPYLDFYVPPAWHWTEAAAKALPWNLPLLPALLYLAVAAAMFRWAEWLPGGEAGPVEPPSGARRMAAVYRFGPIVGAILLPLLIALTPGSADLAGRKIVACDQGRLDWEKPVFDRYGRESAGTYGMLPALVESLGGRFVRSADLAPEDLAEADVLILFHPDRIWPEQFRQRIWQFVREGGSLLLVAGTSMPEDQLAATVNQVLQPTSMEVRFDTAAAAVPYFHGALQVLPHPAVSGVADRHNRFGRILGPSIAVGWPARPLLVGQYGWSDPGSDAALNMSYRLDAGERLGDLVLAAEQRLGKGTIVALTDPFCLTNEGLPTSFPFTGKLLCYLAQRPGNPQSVWRQALGLLIVVLLVGWLAWRSNATQVAAVSAALAVALVLVQTANGTADVLPGRSGEASTPIAYIDGSHLEAYSDDPWGFDDVTGLKLTLMRNGYLPLVAPDLRPERLAHAAMLISIAPARAFSVHERQSIRGFVERGGIFISMAGAEDAGPSQTLLADFGFRVPPPTLLPPPGTTEPRYDRHFRSRYLDAGVTGGHDCYVALHAAWPIECTSPDAIPLVADFDNRPVAAARRIGSGKVVVIGDTGFAMNKNLEYIGGQPFDGGYENAHFWRWLLTWLNDRPAWIPPPPKAESSPATESEGTSEGPADAATGREVSP